MILNNKSLLRINIFIININTVNYTDIKLMEYIKL